MYLFFSYAGALFVTIALMPILIRYAGPWQLVDEPNPRKVHADPIPRCGGIGLAVGVFVSVVLWVDWDVHVAAVLAGLATVAAVGFWDDRTSLGYLPKLVGHFAAAALLVAGGVSFTHLPLMGLEPVSPLLGGAVTMVFVVAVTNAVNLSDGLDGLAAGSTLISLAVIAALSFTGDGSSLLLIAAALAGGIMGFMRFNTHPAIVFLGDGGSYLLGFAVAALTVLLLKDVNAGLSPVVALLIPGLPLVDMIWVALDRAFNGRSPFLPDAGHFHHRLLAVGLAHHDAVGIYYLIHCLLAVGAVALAYEADWIVLSFFLGLWVGLAGLHIAIRNKRFIFKRPILTLVLAPVTGSTGKDRRRTIDSAISLGFAAFVGLSLLNIDAVPSGIAMVPAAMVVALLASLAIAQIRFDAVIRFCIHGAALIVVYLSAGNNLLTWYPPAVQFLHLALLLALVAFSMRHDGLENFRLTTFDSLLVITVTVLALVFAPRIGGFPLAEFVTKAAMLLYIAEYVFRGGSTWPKTTSRFVTSAGLCLCLGAIAYRGLFA